MAVLITKQNCKLSDVNGFRVVESMNPLGTGGSLSLSSARTQNLVFTSASANCVGVVLPVYIHVSGVGYAAASTYYDVLVELQENTGYPSSNSWTTRASKQLSCSSISNNVANPAAHTWIVDFQFTTPYAIDNSPAVGSYYKWRLQISRAGSGSTPYIMTSNGTLPSYYCYTDAVASFTNNDTLVKRTGDVLEIDQSFTMQGTLGSGVTDYAPCFVICKSASGACGSNQEIIWNPNASITANFDGAVVYGAHSCFNVGVPISFTGTLAADATSATLAANWAYATGSYQIHFSDNTVRTVTLTNGNTGVSWSGGLSDAVAAWGNVAIPISSAAILNWSTITNGSYGGFRYSGAGYQTGRKASFYFYGERPAYERTTLDGAIPYSSVTANATTDEITWTAHGLSDGQAIFLSALTTLPGGITEGVLYYARPTDSSVPANTFALYDTEAHALAGGASGKIDITSAGGGVRCQGAIITSDVTGWSVGDVIGVAGMSSSSGNAVYPMTIVEISGAKIGVSVPAGYGLAVSRMSGHPVVRVTGYGIKLQGHATKQTYMAFNSPSNLIMDGVEKVDMQSIHQGTAGSTGLSNMPWDDLANTSKHYLTHSSCWRNVSNTGSFLYTVEGPIYGLEVSYINGGYFFNSLATYGIISFASVQKSGPVLFDHNYLVAGYNNHLFNLAYTGMSVFSAVLSNNYFSGYYNSSTATYGWVNLYGANFTLNNNAFWLCNSIRGALNIITVSSLTGSGNTFDGNLNAITFDIGAESKLQLTDTVFGATIANTNDYSFFEGALVDWQENSPTGAATVNTASLPECADGSLLKIRAYNGTPGDIRSWQPEGMFTSSSSKLLGKTLTAGEVLQSAWKTTSDAISGQSCAVQVTCQIDKADYYAGTHSLPELSVSYDSGADVSDSASASTSAQTLLAEFEPSNDNENINVTLSQATDAATDDSGVYWSALTFRQRRYGKTENSYTKIITEVTADVVFNWAALVDDPYITETTEGTVAAYTGITINHSTQTCTIDENHTIQELYDYASYDLTQHMEVPAWFTTIDGATYTSTYDIVIDGIAFTATGKAIDCGSKDFSLINDGTVDAYRITDVDGTLSSLTFTGLKVGSEVRLYKTSDDSEISGGIEETTGTTHTFNFLHTTDITVYAVVLSLGYENMMVEGLTLTNTAQTVPVSQRIDRQYYNPA